MGWWFGGRVIEWLGGWVGEWLGGWLKGSLGGGRVAGPVGGRAVIVMYSQSAYLIGEQVCDLAAHFAFCRSTWLHILLSTGHGSIVYMENPLP